MRRLETPEQDRFRDALVRCGLKTEDVARKIRKHANTLRNGLSRRTRLSLQVRKHVTQIVNAPIWEDVPLERVWTFPAGTEFAGLSSKELAASKQEFGDLIICHRDSFQFRDATPVFIQVWADQTKHLGWTKRRSRKNSGLEKKAEVAKKSR